MKQCPYCREPVHEAATRCRYCTSALPDGPTGDEPTEHKPDNGDRVHLIVDRGLVYFGKFVVGVVVIVVALGAAFFGFDLNRAREDVEHMRKDVEDTDKEAQGLLKKEQEKLTAASKEIDDKLAAVPHQIDDKLASVQHQIEELRVRKEKEVDEWESDLKQRTEEATRAVFLRRGGARDNMSASAGSRAFTVPELTRLYRFPSAQGDGQTIGIAEFAGGLRQQDLKAYFSSIHRPLPDISAVSIDGATNDPKSVSLSGQVMLDAEVVGAVAPKAKLRVYFSTFTSKGIIDLIERARADRVSVLLIGWGQPENQWARSDLLPVNEALHAAVTSGITVVVAAGDDGVAELQHDQARHVDFPASSPWVLAVGGTALKATHGEINSETAWGNGKDRATGGGATGGGVSTLFDPPAWQRDLKGIPGGGGQAGRAIPDVAAAAAPETGYRILLDGTTTVVGGTGAAAALWAGLVALLNEQRGKNLGYLNPVLYQEIGPGGVLRDIASGNNGVGHVTGYQAAVGWDAVSGWGSPDGEKLLDWLQRQHP